MRRFASPWGRLYETPKGLAPSVSTVLRATDPRPFNPLQWQRSILQRGISAEDAQRYAPVLAEQEQLSLVAAQQVLSRWVGQPLPYDAETAAVHAGRFTRWKTQHSTERGNRLHAVLETLLPIGSNPTWQGGCPQVADPTDQLLLQSLWDGAVLSDIASVFSVEQRLWYWSKGYGYAGTEDIGYRSHRYGLVSADWKSKDPKPYCPSRYGQDYKLQLVAYAGAKAARLGIQPSGLLINYCFTDGQPAVQTVVQQHELAGLWLQWQARLKAWWHTVGPALQTWQPSAEAETD